MRKPLEKERPTDITVGVTGSIACYKAAQLVSDLVKAGYPVNVIMTRSAREFVSPLTFQSLSNHRVYLDLFEHVTTQKIEHVELARHTRLLVIAPATANIIGKLAHGIADDFLTTFALASTAPVLLAPAMNPTMYHHALVQRNLHTLQNLGYTLLKPDFGTLACGDLGEGRLIEPDVILKHIRRFAPPSLK